MSDKANLGALQLQLTDPRSSLRRLLDQLPIALVVTSTARGEEIVFSNAYFARAFSLGESGVSTLSEWSDHAVSDAADRVSFMRFWRSTVSLSQPTDTRVMRLTVNTRAGTARYVDVNVIILEGIQLTAFHDLTERTAFEITESIPVGTYTMVLEPGADMAYFSFMSERFLALTGLEREVAASDPLKGFACVHPDDYDHWVQINAEAFKNKQPFYGETRVIVQGEERWITAESKPRDLVDGTVVWEGVLIDVTERKHAEQALLQAKRELEQANRALRKANAELTRLATTDRLLGISNRLHFETLAEEAIKRSDRYGERLALIMLDVDHFKAVNDRLGHLLADQVLLEATSRVSDRLRENDLLARWGGEEFVILLPHCDGAAATGLAESLRALLDDNPFAHAGSVTASFGVAERTEGENLDDWLKRADRALYRAKAGGRNRVACADAFL